MSDFAIHVQNLSKKYHIGAHLNKQNLREAIKDSFKKPIRRVARYFRRPTMTESEEAQMIWALKEVGFQITHGDRLGIIGRNGSGKSTLLKILSRITVPTSGFAQNSWAGAVAFRGRHRISRGVDRERKHLFEWRDSRHEKSRNPKKV